MGYVLQFVRGPLEVDVGLVGQNEEGLRPQVVQPEVLQLVLQTLGLVSLLAFLLHHNQIAFGQFGREHRFEAK